LNPDTPCLFYKPTDEIRITWGLTVEEDQTTQAGMPVPRCSSINIRPVASQAAITEAI